MSTVTLYRIKPEYCDHPDERKLVFVIVNQNEHTGRVNIMPINTDLPVPPVQTVGADNLEELILHDSDAAEEVKTYGDKIKAIVHEYTKLYESLKADSSFAGMAASLATHDLRMGKFTYERALEEVQQYIDASE